MLLTRRTQKTTESPRVRGGNDRRSATVHERQRRRCASQNNTGGCGREELHGRREGETERERTNCATGKQPNTQHTPGTVYADMKLTDPWCNHASQLRAPCTGSPPTGCGGLTTPAGDPSPLSHISSCSQKEGTEGVAGLLRYRSVSDRSCGLMLTKVRQKEVFARSFGTRANTPSFGWGGKSKSSATIGIEESERAPEPKIATTAPNSSDANEEYGPDPCVETGNGFCDYCDHVFGVFGGIRPPSPNCPTRDSFFSNTISTAVLLSPEKENIGQRARKHLPKLPEDETCA